MRRFLENLLPEGRALDIVASTYQVAKNNLYGLIRELGQETSGALAFFAAESAPAVQLAPAATFFELVIDIPPDREAAVYAYTVEAVNGSALLSGSTPAPAGGGPVRLLLPASRFS